MTHLGLIKLNDKLPIRHSHRTSQKLQEMKVQAVIGFVTNSLTQVSFHELNKGYVCQYVNS